ncbi:NAD+ synthase [Anthocerotibacter panamensis]|uniref:NAD+ synthase n=1 Tax=Anthocerotibacter panamensis TaxID=2857077 RepID=UPI001C4080E1|nr:NAD+ synthase [Anthocerotibacter panamensis]
MRIALVQLNPRVGDLTANSQAIAQAVLSLDPQPDLVVTPELSLVGYPPRDLLLQPAFVQTVWHEAEQLAQRLAHTAPVLVGAPVANPQSLGRPLYNSALLLHQGRIADSLHKTLLPTYDVFDEDRYFEPYVGSRVIRVGKELVGVSICEDLWNDRDYWSRPRYHHDPVQSLVAQGASLLVNLSASPYTRDKQRLREDMLCKLAYKHRLPLVYVNQVGGNDDLIFDGYSLMLNAQGDVIARARGFAPDILVVDETGGRLCALLEPEEELWEALVLGTRDYVRKCGFRQVLLGLSGGIDSALTAAIACDALGSKNVLGVLMPSPYSSSGSVSDSLTLAQNLGMQTLTLPIAPAMDAYDQILQEAFTGYSPDVTEENIQARIRGNLLMALSNKYGALLLTTGNKSELAVGYCTLYGDMSGGLGVIADLPKTQVYTLAHWLNRDGTILPEAILTKAPSAELRPDQTDQDALPPYELLDAILERHLADHQGAEEIIRAGYPPVVVTQILAWVKRAEFKRHQTPPGLKVTDRAFGTGWRMPIARA